MTAAPPYVEIQKVSKSFGAVLAVDEVDLTISQGEIFALLGSSGCGKSTLLRMMAGFETPTSGKILIDGKDIAAIPPYQRPVNMMFQSYALFPHMTVEENIAFGLKQEKLPKHQIQEKVAEVLKLVAMENFEKRKSHQLSGGQKQRVALARILVKRPKVLLLDEPMAALDKKLRVQMQLELVDIIERVGVTCVMVTHDQEEAMTMAFRMSVMDKGHIVQTGTPTEIYESPINRFCAEFIGSINLFSGKITQAAADHVVIDSPDLPPPIAMNHAIAAPVGLDVTVAVRPEKVSVSRQPPPQEYNWAQGTVIDIVYLGGFTTYHVAVNEKIVLATQANLSRLRSGSLTWEETVYLHWQPDSGVVLVP